MQVGRCIRTGKIHQNYYPEPVELVKGRSYVIAGAPLMNLIHQGYMKLEENPSKQWEAIHTPYNGEDLNGKKILVQRTGGIGDWLFISASLRYIREKYSGVHVRGVMGKQYQPMFRYSPYIDKLVDLPYPIEYAKGTDYQVLFENKIENNPEAEWKNAYDLMASSFFIEKELPNSYKIPQVFTGPENDKVVKDCLKCEYVGDEPKIVLQLWASSPVRTMDINFWRRYIDFLMKRDKDVKIFLVANPAHKWEAEKFKDSLLDPVHKRRVVNYCHYATEVLDSAALVKISHHTVAPDSAINHIAAAVDKPCIGIFGGFLGHVRLKYYPKAMWIQPDVTKYPCYPCWQHIYDSCQTAHNEGIQAKGCAPCINSIDPEKIASMSLMLLRGETFETGEYDANED